MRVLCQHGFFFFYPRRASDIVEFTGFFGIELVRENDYYTFPELKGLERYSILGSTYGSLPAIATYEGRHPWEVMRENGWVYSLALGALVPKASITLLVRPPLVDKGYFIAETPLLQPGSRNSAGEQILSYDAFFDGHYFELQILEYGDG